MGFMYLKAYNKKNKTPRMKTCGHRGSTQAKASTERKAVGNPEASWDVWVPANA